MNTVDVYDFYELKENIVFHLLLYVHSLKEKDLLVEHWLESKAGPQAKDILCCRWP